MACKQYVAVDLGASSGRTIVGSFDGTQLSLEETNRFWNGPTEVGGVLYWDALYLFRNIQEGLALSRKKFGAGLVSMGVDTWGVDFGLLGRDGTLLCNPVHYRDARTDGMMERVFEVIPKERVFEQTGIQFMQLNTLYQLAALAQKNPEMYENASRLLFMPDFLNFWLTGEMAANRTIASTSQFYNPIAQDWASDLLAALNLRTDLFAPLVNPGTILGDYKGIRVVNVGSHDTASAFAAVPVEAGENSAFLSSGTWSLLGVERSEPLINSEALAASFTNEVGVCGTVRFLKNMCGLWMIQELRRNWAEQGQDYSWDDLASLAVSEKPFSFRVDPSDERFAVPGNMQTRIQRYCEETGQRIPQRPGEIVRAVYEGLAASYAQTLQDLQSLTGRAPGSLRVVGGGCRNQALNQFTADATGIPVISGPAEATAIGNILIQMLAAGDISSLAEGRCLVRDSFAGESAVSTPCAQTGK